MRRDRREERKNTYITLMLLAIVLYMGTRVFFEVDNVAKRNFEYLQGGPR